MCGYKKGALAKSGGKRAWKDDGGSIIKIASKYSACGKRREDFSSDETKTFTEFILCEGFLVKSPLRGQKEKIPYISAPNTKESKRPFVLCFMVRVSATRTITESTNFRCDRPPYRLS